ncbi:MAG: hypothetical protein GEU75_16950 [Dehalococcoidia bacterium]|nr:hypothetical protein [Dehalococcoidia bacterium]
MAPNSALEAYFEERNLLSEVSFNGRLETDIGDVYDAWQLLPANERAEVDVDFNEINSLTTEHAMTTFVTEAKYLGVDLGDEFSREGGHDKAFSVFLRNPDLFARVLQIVDADERSSKFWQKRNDLPPIDLHFDQDTLDRLADALRYFFRESEGRGHNCFVETCEREEFVYFFCYLENHGRADLVFGNDDKPIKVAQRRAFEVIFVITPSGHSLDILYEGKRRTVKTLETLFARIVLGFDLPERRDETVYELNGLNDRRFIWNHDPSSRITGIAVKALKFAAIGGIKRRKTLEADPSRGREDIYDFMESDFETGQAPYRPDGKPPLAAFNIIQARIQVTFQPVPRRKIPTKTFSISFPNGCSLGHEGQDAAIREMLRLSGIEQQPAPSNQRELVGSASTG